MLSSTLPCDVTQLSTASISTQTFCLLDILQTPRSFPFSRPYTSASLMPKCCYCETLQTHVFPFQVSVLRHRSFYLSVTLLCRKDPVSVPTIRPWRKAKRSGATLKPDDARSRKRLSAINSRIAHVNDDCTPDHTKVSYAMEKQAGVFPRGTCLPTGVIHIAI